MSVYEGGLRPGSQDAARRGGSVADAGARGTRRPADAIGRAHVASSQKRHSPGLLARWLGAALRLVFPVILLAAVGLASVLYNGASVQWPGVPERQVDLGLVLLPLSFFVIHLTNRRYGPGYAFGQIVGAWLVAFFAAPSVLATLNGPLPDIRVLLAFGSALFIAQSASIIVFDRLRGPSWWQAPFFASLLGGLAFCLIAFPSAYAGAESGWTNAMLGCASVMVTGATVLIIPYWLLRPLVRPGAGFGGY